MSLRLLFTVVLLSTMGPILGAQSAPDSAQCRATLDAASRDSQSVRIGILVFPLDRANHITAAYGGLIGAGIRQFLAVPNPLALHVYSPGSAILSQGQMDGGYAALTLRSSYRATLHRDGHLTGIRTLGGTRDAAFDGAILVAMAQLSASELLPPPVAPAATFTGDSLDIRIVVTPESMSLTTRGVSGPATEGVTPVVQLRLPIRHVTQKARVKAGQSSPIYPTELRHAGVEGSTLLEFVVDPSGRADPTTVQVLNASAPQFVDAVLDVLPDIRFEPMYVEGCPVSVQLQQPFDFSLQQ
jgi:TonB family protein